jgi:hypothetical protein
MTPLAGKRASKMRHFRVDVTLAPTKPNFPSLNDRYHSGFFYGILKQTNAVTLELTQSPM